MDHDGDGIQDLISGSYDPGDIWLFRGLGGGRYEAGRVLVDEDGVALVHHPKELVRYHELKRKDGNEEQQATLQARVASFGSWPTPVDWDADGDLDLVIGTFAGRIHLRKNVGTRKVPEYSRESPEVALADGPLAVNMHAAPVAADWDGDGRFDLVVGAGDGSVQWFRNTGEQGKPSFANGQVLVSAKAPGKFLRQVLAPDEVPQQGVRAQVCVADLDLDGKLDLLVGDYSQVCRQRRDLTAEDRRKLAEILAKEAELGRQKGGDAKAAEALAAQRRQYCEADAPSCSFVWFYRRIGP